jgi:N-acetylglucosaminyldiphosphoundecaprenol N-acetyl-beta-D-mannosaminyltransferase
MKLAAADYRTILGIRFFQGTAKDAVRRMRRGGLLVVPAAPALKDIETDLAYRESLRNADMVITDSAFMVMVWNRMHHDSMTRLSGLEYLRELLRQPDVRAAGNCVWVMANEEAAQKNLEWLLESGIEVHEECVYIAPVYGSGDVEDPVLLEKLERLKPEHVIVTIGGGVQEQLGWYLRRTVRYSPAIHCIGAAIAFLSGDQVRIPAWADHLYLGWLFRTLSEPKRFGPRYWDARKLFGLLRQYHDKLPAMTVKYPVQHTSNAQS